MRRRLASWARRSLAPIPCAYVLWFRRDRLVKNAIGSFLAAPLFALVALRELELERVSYSQDVTVVTALVLLAASIRYGCEIEVVPGVGEFVAPGRASAGALVGARLG